ncbi:hypothetical protein [Streptomyces pristinaespiralis]|uniref:hypothetical protein n=1 Tax=Streptomyces pristinaespiralis TaxID=38300 RepID=UPI003408565F
MADRQTTQLLDSMRRGMPFEFATTMSMTKRLATLVCVAELFGYQYAGARQEVFSIKLAFTPDPSPQAQARAAQYWPYAPRIPEIPHQVLELNKKRVLFDLSSKAALLRRLPVIGIALLLASLRPLSSLGDSPGLALGYVCFLAVLVGLGVWVNSARHKRAGAQLDAAGFVRHEPSPGQVSYLPPGSLPPAQWHEPQQYGPGQQGYAQQPYGGPQPPYPAPQHQHQPYAQPYAQQHQPYAQQPPAQPPYGHQPYGGQPPQ